MSVPLFVPAPSIDDLFAEKVADAVARMPDDDKKWPAFILSLLLRELPFLSNYSIEIVLDRVEPEAGVALGYAQVRNKTVSRPQDNVPLAGNIIRIPILVQEGRLQKFLTFEAGKQIYPLTDTRVQQAMQNPAVFDTDSRTLPVSPSLVDQTYPPYTQRLGFGRVTSPSTTGFQKLSSFDRNAWEAGIQQRHGKPVSHFRAKWDAGETVPLELAEAFDVDDQAADHPRKKALQEKKAYIFGAPEPSTDYLASAAVPVQDRNAAVHHYLRAKAKEEPTRWRDAVGGGALLGGAAVGIPTLLMSGGSPRKALMGGLVGAGVGGLVGAGVGLHDRFNISDAQAADANSAERDSYTRQRIRDAVEAKANERRRRISGAEAALLLHTIADHADRSSRAGAGSSLTSALPSVPCSYCGTKNAPSSVRCSSCGAPTSATKQAGLFAPVQDAAGAVVQAGRRMLGGSRQAAGRISSYVGQHAAPAAAAVPTQISGFSPKASQALRDADAAIAARNAARAGGASAQQAGRQETQRVMGDIRRSAQPSNLAARSPAPHPTPEPPPTPVRDFLSKHRTPLAAGGAGLALGAGGVIAANRKLSQPSYS